MRIEPVEIYSDESNYAVLRHPGRKFPGALIQGDSLYILCRQADDVCASIDKKHPSYGELNDLRNQLWERLNHYKSVLAEHAISLPFSEQHNN